MQLELLNLCHCRAKAKAKKCVIGLLPTRSNKQKKIASNICILRYLDSYEYRKDMTYFLLAFLTSQSQRAWTSAVKNLLRSVVKAQVSTL